MSEAIQVTAENTHTTVEEFLAFDDGTDTRYELVDGQIVAMAPPLFAHGSMVANTIVALSKRLPQKCRVATESGIKLPHRDDAFYVADVVVSCAEAPYKQHWAPEPRIIVEVLSPSTTLRDRLVKRDDYCLLPSVRSIVFLSTDELKAETWRRWENGWLVTTLRAGESIVLDGIDGPIPLAEIYEGVSMPGDPQ